jgi:hypothetical protein
MVCTFGATLDASSIHNTDIKPNISWQLIPPGGEIQVDSQIIPQEQLSAVKAGKSPLFVYGTVWYEDIFGASHWTQYCWSVDPNRGVNYEGPKHNDCDTRD